MGKSSGSNTAPMVLMSDESERREAVSSSSFSMVLADIITLIKDSPPVLSVIVVMELRGGEGERGD